MARNPWRDPTFNAVCRNIRIEANQYLKAKKYEEAREAFKRVDSLESFNKDIKDIKNDKP